jgi:hypothetical protein
MSRWIEQFKNHPFQTIWKELKNNLNDAKIDDETVITSVMELVRLKKVISYVDSMLESIDPELVPATIWESFSSQADPCWRYIAGFNSNRDIGQIQNANAHADNLLSYIRPYMIIEGKAGAVLRKSATQSAQDIDSFVKDFKSRSDILIGEIKDNKLLSDRLKDEVLEVSTLAEQFKTKMKGDGVGDIGIERKVEEINSLYNETIVDGENSESTKTGIAQAKENVFANKQQIDEALTNTTGAISNFNKFYEKIFGSKNDSGTREGGIEDDLNRKIKSLSDFEIKQTARYKALNSQIESLLPGATSAGLATAYREMKDSFDAPIKNATGLYGWSIAILVVASLIFSIDSIGGEQWIKFLKFDDWTVVLKGLVYKLPFYGPVIWFAYTASKRRSESQRLQQEYAHKEALAKSYDSYKKQLQELDGEDKDMQKEFIRKAIDAIAYNASQTLDGKHGDNHPVTDLAGKLFDTLNKISEPSKK